MKFGITGTSGVLGTILCEKLGKLGINISKFKGNICNKDEIFEWVKNNDWDGVIHLAALVATKDVKENLLLAYDVNVNGTINLLTELKKTWANDKKWFFYASTSHVYKSSNKPLKESDEIAPISLYGKTKYMAETIVNDIGMAKNSCFNTCIGRIFSFYHNTQKSPFLYPNIIERLNKENLDKEFFLFGADSVRDFLNAEDVVDLIIKLACKNSTGIYNIASGKPQKIRDFVQSLTNKSLKIKTTKEKDFLVANIEKLTNELNKEGK